MSFYPFLREASGPVILSAAGWPSSTEARELDAFTPNEKGATLTM